MAAQQPAGEPMCDLTAFQRDLLTVVAQYDGPGEGPNGLTLKDELDRLYQTEINHGRLYPNLDDLVELGLVDKGKIDNRTNSYLLTRRGERELTVDLSWRREAIEG